MAISISKGLNLKLKEEKRFVLPVKGNTFFMRTEKRGKT